MVGLKEIGYLEEMRQRLGLDENDTAKDEAIADMTPMQRVQLIAGWLHGDNFWADTWQDYFKSQGLYLTTNPEADGVIES